METLVLDYTYQPIDRVPWQDAVTNWAVGKCEIIASYADRIIHQGLELYMPAVVRFVRSTGKRKRVIRFSRDNVLLRDRFRCQYCNTRVTRKSAQYEHVIPRAQGGKTVWTNIVIACHRCNQRKAGRTPEQAGMRLRRDPVKPRSLPPRLNLKLIWQEGLPESWRQWLPTRDQIASYEYWHGELEE